MGEGKFALAIDQMRSQFGNLAVEFDHLWAIVGRQFKAGGRGPSARANEAIPDQIAAEFRHHLRRFFAPLFSDF